MKEIKMEKQIIIFGAGDIGKELFSKLDERRVAYFCDNNHKKVGSFFLNREVISFDKLTKIYNDFIIFIALKMKDNVRKQLEKAGIVDYIVYMTEEYSNKRFIVDNVNSMETDMDNLLNDILCEDTCKLKFLEYKSFKESVVWLKNKLENRWAFFSNKTESDFYGHKKMLMDYAGIAEKEKCVFPELGHSVFFRGIHQGFSIAGIYSSYYDKQIHNVKYPYVPILDVGPYIYYAKPTLSSEEIIKEKKKNGNTVTIFIMHSTEKDNIFFDDEVLINEIKGKWMKRYEHVMVCAYWNDIDKSIYARLDEMGVEIVSAGYRFDDMFINRLRSIFELSDDVVVYGVMSVQAYAFILEKKCISIPINMNWNSHNNEPELRRIASLNQPWEQLDTIIFESSGEKNRELTSIEKEIIEKCFGLKSIRSPEEIKSYFLLCKEIMNECDNYLIRYPQAVYKIYAKYQKKVDVDKLNLLSYTTGHGIWNL